MQEQHRDFTTASCSRSASVDSGRSGRGGGDRTRVGRPELLEPYRDRPKLLSIVLSQQLGEALERQPTARRQAQHRLERVFGENRVPARRFDRLAGEPELALADPDQIAEGQRGARHQLVVQQGAVRAVAVGDHKVMPAGGEPISVRVIARRPDTIVGFGDTRIHAETATFEVRASEVASPRPGDQLAVDGETFVIQEEPERRDPDRLVWTVDVRPT